MESKRKVSPWVEVIVVDNRKWNKIIENRIKFIDVVIEWMHGCIMENVQKIKIKLENIWIDLIRSIYAPYSRTCMVPATARGRAIMTAPTSARGWALSPTLISKRDETHLPTQGSQPRESHHHGSGQWVGMDGGGQLQTGRWPTACL